jgi:hypothetical protein
MNGTARSERFESHLALLPTARSMESGIDDEFGPESSDLSRDHTSEEEPVPFRPLRAAALWLSMAVLGIMLALVWRNVGAQVWSDAQRWLASAAGSTSSKSSPVEEQLGRIVRELDVIKKNLDELRAAQQQTAANVTFLQAGEEELRQRVSSFPRAHWYSDLGILTTYRTAAEKKLAAAASLKLMPTARLPSEAQEARFGRRGEGALLSLVPPRP